MTCDRLERDDLLGHLGEQMDPHVEQCHVCRAISYGYARITTALAEESHRALPAGWRERTLARIHAERAARRRRTAAASVALSLAGTAALILILAPRGERPPSEGGGLVVRVERGQTVRRAAPSARAHPGNLLRVSAPARGEHVELRIYRGDGALMARCPGLPPPTCQRGDAVELLWELPHAGVYRAVWLESSSPLPQPSGDLDADVLAAERAGARVEESEPIDVR